MTDPISFATKTPRFGLPLLFTAQAQTETFVNEAHVLTDALLHPFAQGMTATPPANPINGQCWIVDSGSTGSFAGHEQDIACFFDGQWLFATPGEGMSAFDISISQMRHFRNTWAHNPQIDAPNGGTTVDLEARDAIVSLVTALQTAGILPIT